MSPTTERVITDIVRAVADGARIAPVTFTACYPRANVSAAFRATRKRGLIVVDCLSVCGTPIYRMGLRLAGKEVTA